MTGTDVAADFTRTVGVEVSPAVLQAAVRTAEGVSGWWFPTSEAGPDLLHVAMGDSGVELRVEPVDEPTTWHVVACPIEPAWVGTDISFAVRPSGRGAQLTFTHHRLGTLACAEVCFAGWSYYLPSLVSYAETGAGRPGPRPH